MFCSDIPAPTYLIFSESVPSLLYYSHIPTGIVTLLMGIFVFIKNRTLVSKILMSISVVFASWLLFDLILWVNPDSRILMFLWSLFGILNALISILFLYFVYVFVEKKDIGLKLKGIVLLLILPVVFLLPSQDNLKIFDVVNCQALEGIFYTNYYYGLNFLVIAVVAFTYYKYMVKRDYVIEAQADCDPYTETCFI